MHNSVELLPASCTFCSNLGGAMEVPKVAQLLLIRLQQLAGAWESNGSYNH